MRKSKILLRGTLGAFLLWTSVPLSAAVLPSPPETFVLDEVSVLDAQTKQGLNALFKAQENATGEQIVFAVFDSLQGEDLVSWTNQIFKNWQIGKKGKDNGVLLALYWKEHRSRIEVGYGLEPLLTDAKSKRVLEMMREDLKAGRPNHAVRLAALEILRVIQSPLIASGEAEKILQLAPRQGDQFGQDTIPPGLALFLIILILIAIYLVGRFGRRRRSYWGWGGGSGPWDDFGSGGGSSSGGGGFSGGGGSSGGGGASGDW